MSGEYKIPYRAPCGGFDPARVLRVGCDVSPPPSPLPNVFTNITKVDDWRAEDDPEFNAGGIPPYARPTTGNGACADDPDCSVGHPSCNAPGRYPGDSYKTCGGVSVGTPDFRNCFEDSGVPMVWPECAAGWYKAVQSRKVHHGRRGFLDEDTCTVTPAEEDECGCGAFEPPHAAPQTKYLSQSVDISCAYTLEGSTTPTGEDPESHPELVGAQTQSVSESRTAVASIDRYSGVQTLSGCGRTLTDEFSGSGNLSARAGSPFWPQITFVCDFGSGPVTVYLADVLASMNVNCGVITASNSSCGNFVFGTPGEVEAWLTSLTGTVPGLTITDVTVTVTDTQIYIAVTSDYYLDEELHDIFGYPYNNHWEGSQTVEATIDLADAYTAADVYDDLKSLAAAWALDDDAVYPWRADEFVTIAPLMTYDEWPTPRVPQPLVDCTLYTGAHWEGEFDDPPADMPENWIEDNQDDWIEQGYADGVANPPLYTGVVVGSPQPVGYERFFDRWHRNWSVCGAGGYYVSSIGGTSPYYLPTTATQWTEALNNFKPGAQLEDSGGVFTLQKVAYARVGPRPSVNFFRPCGLDRYRVDETKVSCITDNTDGVITVDPANDADGSVPCVVGGELWTVSGSGTSYTLVTKLADLPAVLQTDANQFGPLRWPDAWSICGKAACSFSEASGTVTVTSSGVKYLRTGDVVDFCDADGTVTDASKTITLVSEGIFTFSGSIPTGNFVKANDAPDYWWHDNLPKGEYQLLTWLHNFRDIAIADQMCQQVAYCDCDLVQLPEDADYECVDTVPGTLAGGADLRANQVLWGMPRSVSSFDCVQHCFTFACRSIICLSPNGETFATPGVTSEVVDFPESFAADDRYGALWQSDVRQYMTDPFWQAPHPVCGGSDGWTEASGSNESGMCPTAPGFYAARPVVEAIQAAPSTGGPSQEETAPSLPGDIFINVLGLDELDTVVEPDGIVLPPPGNLSGLSPVIVTPWGDWQRELACVCADQPFSLNYRANGIPSCL